ncbi:MAG: hypothetical protein Q8K36_06415, partial [Alphaproteobacteria bacterium]|nr:hypothetical protein [Alphaproteobacteria bacterium]
PPTEHNKDLQTLAAMVQYDHNPENPDAKNRVNKIIQDMGIESTLEGKWAIMYSVEFGDAWSLIYEYHLSGLYALYQLQKVHPKINLDYKTVNILKAILDNFKKNPDNKALFDHIADHIMIAEFSGADINNLLKPEITQYIEAHHSIIKIHIEEDDQLKIIGLDNVLRLGALLELPIPDVCKKMEYFTNRVKQENGSKFAIANAIARLQEKKTEGRDKLLQRMQIVDEIIDLVLSFPHLNHYFEYLYSLPFSELEDLRNLIQGLHDVQKQKDELQKQQNELQKQQEKLQKQQQDRCQKIPLMSGNNPPKRLFCK